MYIQPELSKSEGQLLDLESKLLNLEPNIVKTFRVYFPQETSTRPTICFGGELPRSLTVIATLCFRTLASESITMSKTRDYECFSALHPLC